jgi:hypothetical protein
MLEILRLFTMLHGPSMEKAKEITTDQVLKLFYKMKPIMDERLIWFAYYKDEPIAMWINIPDLNQYFKHFNGKFGWLEKSG